MNKLFLLTILIAGNLWVNQAQAQRLSAIQKKFLQKNAQLITSNTQLNALRWKAVARKVKNKQIVSLGEFNHGSKEVFLLRNELIKYLHQKHGFKVILFESGIGELLMPDTYKKKLSATQMTYGFFSGWRTKEFRALMQYVKANDLSIGGFDVQRTGGSFRHFLREKLPLYKVDTSLYANLENRYTHISRLLKKRKTKFEQIAQSTQQLIRDYQKLLDLLGQHKEKQKNCLLIVQTLRNRIYYLRYRLQFLKDKNGHKRWAARDSMMAANVNWLSENIFPGQKMIVVAHNYHIAKYNQREQVMGEFLKKKWGQAMYVLGVFAANGKFKGNYGKAQALSPPDEQSLDIKHVINHLEGEVHFINLPNKVQKGGEWLHAPITVKDTFINLSRGQQMTLAKHYDGLLLLKTISPPEK